MCHCLDSTLSFQIRMVSFALQESRLGIALIFLFRISTVTAQSQELKVKTEISNQRDPKWFSFIRITNRVCGNEDNRGSCYSSKDCMSRGGVALTGISCANGFGVCCSVSVSCAMGNRRVSTSENVVTLASATGVASCIFSVAKSAPDVCQLQVDLMEFSLGMGPDPRGNCMQTVLTITDSVTVASGFKLCGPLSSRRLFLTYERGAGGVIDFDFRSGNTPITYKLRITQIKCIDQIVPDQCLEYYDETQTMPVTSFGHPNYMINNPIYNICVDSPASASSIEWEPCLENPVAGKTFRLSPWFSNMAGDIQVPISGYDNCMGTTFVDILGANRHCGARLKVIPTGPPIMSMVKPFTLAVHVVPYNHAGLRETYVFPYTVLPAELDSCTKLGVTNGAMIRAFEACADVASTMPPQLYCRCAISIQPTPPFIEPLPTPNPPRTGFCLTYNVV